MGRFNAFALLAVGIAVTACGPVDDRLTPANNPTITSVNQPVVQRTDYVLDLNATGSGLAEAERRRLDDWFASLRLGYGDRLWVDEAGYGDAGSRSDIAAVASRYGVLLSDGAPVTAGSVQPGSVRVIVSRSTASVPGCPIWEDPQINDVGKTSSNYGCATNSNLAAMIADPNDLVLGQVGSDRNGETGAKAVGNYVRRVPSGTKGTVKAESTQ